MSNILVYVAATRAILRVRREYKMPESRLRTLLALRCSYLCGLLYISVGKLYKLAAIADKSQVYASIIWLEQSGYVEKRKISGSVRVGDVFSLTGKGLLVCQRFEDLLQVEMKS